MISYMGNVYAKVGMHIFLLLPFPILKKNLIWRLPVYKLITNNTMVMYSKRIVYSSRHLTRNLLNNSFVQSWDSCEYSRLKGANGYMLEQTWCQPTYTHCPQWSSTSLLTDFQISPYFGNNLCTLGYWLKLMVR